MSSDEVVEGKCHHCSKPVGVRLNRSQLAYYRCPWCLFEGRHHSARGSTEYMRALGAPNDRSAPAPEKPAPAAAPKPAAKPEEKPAPPKPAAPVSPFKTLIG